MRWWDLTYSAAMCTVPIVSVADGAARVGDGSGGVAAGLLADRVSVVVVDVERLEQVLRESEEGVVVSEVKCRSEEKSRREGKSGTASSHASDTCLPPSLRCLPGSMLLPRVGPAGGA